MAWLQTLRDTFCVSASIWIIITAGYFIYWRVFGLVRASWAELLLGSTESAGTVRFQPGDSPQRCEEASRFVLITLRAPSRGSCTVCDCVAI